MSQAHHEINLELYVVQKLVEQGWLEEKTEGFDTERALFEEDVLSWIQTTQPAKWEKLETRLGDAARETVLKRLASKLDSVGTVQVLRQGFEVAGCGLIEMSEAAPEDGRNQEVIARYQANRLRVVRQLKYNPAHNWAIDLGLFINGIPVATIELKTDFTQSVEDAMEQYRCDRLPIDVATKRKEPLLTFKRGAVVHFAMSDSEIQMTTHLQGHNTYFLPFNQGKDGRAGNPARDDGEYPVAYFWERVCQPDAWLRIFHSFVYVEKKDKVDAQGNWSTKETLIFPRFHQWEAVNKMITDAKANGPGMTYLCEHSAGSGKTSSIAWTAHDLIRLRKDDGESVFNSVIIVTDRNVLDSQLQDAVKQIDHQMGVIAAIDRQKSSKSKSTQLAEALSSGVPIIVVTIQTFPYAMEAILTEKSLADSNFAVIIDEAHASQTGATASKLQATLSLQDKDELEKLTVEELLEKVQQSRQRSNNVSYFAFTATPKHSTMMLFGRPADPTQEASKDNLPESFHIYPMRQAIDEGFILDVLQNYTPYKAAYKLSEEVEADKRVDSKQARKALAQWMTLHPTNVTQKVQFIMEHFNANVAQLLNGEAKAMVVTSSRAAAVRYKLAFDQYIEQHPQYEGIKALVAFSGSVSGSKANHPGDANIQDDPLAAPEDAEFTESNMNTGAGGADLRHVFDRPEYRLMLVANKFQTGFDQPKLVAMYLDKKIANAVEIVQTLSRLNRVCAGKDKTYVIDFVNDPEVIREAFARYDAGAEIEDVQDPNIVYDIKQELDACDIYEASDLDAFREARFKTIRDVTGGAQTHKALYAATQRPTDIFNGRLKLLRESIERWEQAIAHAEVKGDEAGMQSAEHQRSEFTQQREQLMLFKKRLTRFSNAYAYCAQLIDFGDPELENFAAFAKLLSKRLDGVAPEQVDLRGLALTGFEIKSEKDEGETPDGQTLKPEEPPGGEGRDREKQKLSEIINRLNSIFGDVAPLKDQAAFANQVASIASESDVVMAQVENNTREQAMHGDLPDAVQQAVVRAFGSHQGLAKLLLQDDQQSLNGFTDLVYELIKAGKRVDLDGLND
jgi:type I restriction enzyme R subunit